MKILRSVIIFIIVGFVIAAASLLYSSDSPTLGPSYTFSSSEDNQGISVCRTNIIFDEMMYLRGWPYGVVEVSIYDCRQGEYDDVYPLSYLANTLIFSLISYVVYVLGKMIKKKGVKNG
jgi:hypothetical protein